MKAIGITAEYNPFHNGHRYHIEEARRISGADAVVVCMSGNFVQRGGPAVRDKWTRAGWALSHGADLVIELPQAFASADAGRFACSAVSILAQAGCDAVSFGSECADKELLKTVSQRTRLIRDEIPSFVKEHPGLSYPAARTELYKETFAFSDSIDDELRIISSPNDILAIEYISELSGLDFYPVKRLGAGYNQEFCSESGFQSASGIRKMVADGDIGISQYMPSAVAENLSGEAFGAIEREFYRLAAYKIIEAGRGEIDNTPSGGEGLSSRLKEAVLNAESLDELISLAKSKRYTFSRLSRLVTQLVLGITRDNLVIDPSYIRVLGFTARGRELLSEISRKSAIPVITNPSRQQKLLNDEGKRLLAIDSKASDIYNLLCGSNLYRNSDYVKKPIIINS